MADENTTTELGTGTTGESLAYMKEGAQIMSDNISVGDALYATATAVPEYIGDRAYNLGKKFHKTDYNSITIRNGKQTLLGDDAADMFLDPKIVERTDSNGSTYDEVTTSADYSTDMMVIFGGESDTDYDVMDDDKKVMYEMIMYTKKYAAMNPGEVNGDMLGEYKSKMDQYKAYCDSRDDLNWEAIVGLVSSEFQQESMVYAEGSDEALGGLSNEDNRLIATTAHNYLLEATKDSYKDIEHTQVTANEDFSYEDTLDMTPQYGDKKVTRAFGLFGALGQRIKDWFIDLKDSFTQPIKNDIASYGEAYDNIEQQQQINKVAREQGVDVEQSLIQDDIVYSDGSKNDSSKSEERYNQAVNELGVEATDDSSITDSNDYENE